MKTYTIYKIDNHFKLFYNFNTSVFDKRENKLTSDNFCILNLYCKKVCIGINYIENLKSYGSQHYATIK